MASINKKKIALIEKYTQEKLRNKAMKLGVTLKSPETVFLSADTKFGQNITIHPYVVIGQKVKIGRDVEILPFSHIENATLEANVRVGPFSRIRPGSFLSKGSRVGNFVEVKKSKVGKNSKINHLSYVGDTTIGKNANIGAGTITCNYDGISKHKTIIQDEVFVGSGSQLVAPVTLHKGAYVAAGSTITEDVPEQALGIARSQQVNKKKWVRKENG